MLLSCIFKMNCKIVSTPRLYLLHKGLFFLSTLLLRDLFVILLTFLLSSITLIFFSVVRDLMLLFSHIGWMFNKHYHCNCFQMAVIFPGFHFLFCQALFPNDFLHSLLLPFFFLGTFTLLLDMFEMLLA